MIYFKVKYPTSLFLSLVSWNRVLKFCMLKGLPEFIAYKMVSHFVEMKHENVLT